MSKLDICLTGLVCMCALWTTGGMYANKPEAKEAIVR